MYQRNYHSAQQQFQLLSAVSRRHLSLFILLIFCTHLADGLIQHHGIWVVEPESLMDETEQNIAQQITSSLGTEVTIQIADEQQLELMHTQGYASPFFFSEELDGQTVYYTIDQTPSTNEIQQSVEDNHSRDSMPGPNSRKSLNTRLLSKFFLSYHTLNIKKPSFQNAKAYTVPLYREDAFISIPTPPPRLL